eukprot:gene11120-12290_t
MRTVVYFNLVLLILGITQNESWKTSDLPSDKYISYLQYPHINFGGIFRANVATGNNIGDNYDSDNFFEHQDKYDNPHGGKLQWNPDGTNDFTLQHCIVKSACHVNGKCTNQSQVDQICGRDVIDGGLGSFAKMVDIDVGYMVVPEVWGLKVKIPGFLSGDMEPTPLAEFWGRMNSGDQGKGGAYQSVLRNIVWGDRYNTSEAVVQIKETMHKVNSSELSIIFYLDQYSLIAGASDHLLGRIIGTIGVSGPRAPKRNTWGRSMEAMIKGENGKMKKAIYRYMHRGSFVLNEPQQRLYVNFENSFKMAKSGNPVVFPGPVFIGYFRKEGEQQQHNNTVITCARNFTTIRRLPNTTELNNVYWNYGGIVSVKLSDRDTRVLRNRSLAVLLVIGNKCEVLMQEAADGIIIKPMNSWVFRLQSGQAIETDFFVAKFGRPHPNADVAVVPRNRFDDTKGTGKVTKPRFNRILFKTDSRGITHVKFPTTSSTYKRRGMDGNLEGYQYFVVGSDMEKINKISQDSALIARVFHNITYSHPVTWVDHVYPIFRQYANLFPVMSSRTFDMANYFDVVDHKKIMQLSLELPMSHPSYMPATRDLSTPKRDMILSWLKQDKPAFGDATKLLNLHRFKELLQLALEITHAGIPPMLTALWSIKDRYNGAVTKTFDRIVWQDMKNMALISNLLVAVGGKPKFLHKGFVPKYLSRMPGGIQKSLIVSLERMSRKSTLDQFVTMKRPEYDPVGMLFRTTIFKYVKSNTKYCKCKDVEQCKKKCKIYTFTTASHGYQKCKQTTQLLMNQSIFKDDEYPSKGYDPYVSPQERHVFEYHSSISRYYNHILLALAHITDCGTNNTIFTGKSSLQMLAKASKNTFGNDFVIHDFATAVRTIERILNIMHGLNVNGQVSQYVGLRAIVKETSSIPIVNFKTKIPEESINEMNLVMKKFRETLQQPVEKRISLFEKAVWPIASNCKHGSYPKGRARNVSKAFNHMYTTFLSSFELLYKTSNVTKRSMRITTIHYMVDAMTTYASMLMRMPIGKNGSWRTGPNAAPTFEPNFGRGLIKMGLPMIKKLAKKNWNLKLYFKIMRKLEDQEDKKPIFYLFKTNDAEYEDEDTVINPLSKNPLLDVSKWAKVSTYEND